MLGVGVEQDLHDADDARVVAIADDADGELAAGQERFDQHRLAKAVEQRPRGVVEFASVGHLGAEFAALAGALGERLDEGWIVAPARNVGAVAIDDDERRGGNAGIANQPLGHRFVEADRHGEGIGECIRLVVEFAQRRHLRLAVAAR